MFLCPSWLCNNPRVNFRPLSLFRRRRNVIQTTRDNTDSPAEPPQNVNNEPAPSQNVDNEPELAQEVDIKEIIINPIGDSPPSSDTNNTEGPDDSAIKNLGEKAEGILEEQKKKVEELAVEKKNAAAALLEQQKEKIGDLLWQTKSDAESTSNEALKQAVDGFESELAKETERVDKVVDDTVKQASSVVDEKLKESEQFLDEKREEAVKSVTSGDSMLNPSAVLGKAKGFLNF